jgi:hypothetical protein
VLRVAWCVKWQGLGFVERAKASEANQQLAEERCGTGASAGILGIRRLVSKLPVRPNGIPAEKAVAFQKSPV